jgi:hypothetical protein
MNMSRLSPRNILRVLFSAFALSLALYVLIFLIVMIFNNAPLTLNTSRKLFFALYVVSIPLVIKFLNFKK